MRHTLIFIFLLSAATIGAQAPGPNMQFQSYFQIRGALPDTIELIHIAYNISVTPAGVEVVKITPPVGAPQTMLVPAWVEEAGRWIGVTKDGITVIWDTSQAEPFLEIASARQVLDMYVMAPVRLQWKQYPNN